MIRRAARFFIADESAAISPLYAVAILTLVAMAGIGFDFGRMVALDSELQNAADQAALAAATQLDGGDDAMVRARNAANNTFADADSDFVNETRFANDDDGRPIVDLSYKFYDGYANDTPGDEVVDDTAGADAKVVEVTVNPRSVFYALTPLVGAFSDDAIGRAMATLENATCNVPPMMFCVPNDSNNVAQRDFPTSADIGKGLHMHMNANAADPWAPGNFGFLDIDYDITGNPNHTLGLNSSFVGCAGDGIESRTGVRDPEADALNSRFDFYSGSVNENSCNGAGDNCPSVSVRKDFTVTETKTIRTSTGVPATPECGDYDTRSGWNENSDAQNFKKDDCFSATTPCTVIGDGTWDYTTYFNARNALNPSYPIPTAADFGKSSMDEVTRYDVYLWELEDASTRLAAERWSSPPVEDPVGASGNVDYTFTNVCAYPEPILNPPGVASSDTQKDRRVLTVAAVDCTGLNGSDVVDILRWVDMFMVQPADINGSDKSFFTEIIGPAERPDGTSAFQYYSRRKAVLIR